MAVFRWILTFITVLNSIVWSLVASAAMPFDLPPGLSIAAAAQQKHGDRFLNVEGVVGHGLATDSNGVGIIVVFTESPVVPGVPVAVDGVKVKTVFSGRFYALAPPLCGGPPSERPAECFSDPEPEPTVDPTARFERPVPIGVSTGHPNITAGTIGARVTDGTDVYALSNNHVFANSNQTSVPENILQPGPYDGGVENGDTYATLVDYEPILFDGSANIMDAAIARSDEASLTTATPADGYGTPSSSIETAAPGLAVKKYGRTTGFTQGIVDSINATVNVCYEGGSSCTKLAMFVNQVVITPGTFSAGGDSGSLIVASDSNAAVALLFAGSSSYTIGSPITPILQRFNVTIDSETAPPPPTGDFALTASGYKVKGQHKVNLEWSGSQATQVDVYRNGVLVETVTNSGFYNDNINSKGGATYSHKVCNQGTETCSNTTVTVF